MIVLEYQDAIASYVREYFFFKIQIRAVSNVKANNKEKTMDPSQRANETRLTQ